MSGREIVSFPHSITKHGWSHVGICYRFASVSTLRFQSSSPSVFSLTCGVIFMYLRREEQRRTYQDWKIKKPFSVKLDFYVCTARYTLPVFSINMD